MTSDGALPKVPATVVAICTYVIMAGFFTQSGVVLGPAAAYFQRNITDTAPIFSYLVGGNLIGIIVSLGIFSILSIKQTLAAAYSVMFAGIVLLCFTHAYSVAALAIGLVGFGGGIGLSTGAVILSKTYAANRRATAFLGTDCAFSVAGFVFPAIAALAIARGFTWQTGYVVVAAIAALVLIGAAPVRFPATGEPAFDRGRTRREIAKGAMVRIGLFGIALALYLCGQSAFLIWAPSYLQLVFALPAVEAGKAVSSFWGPSIFGLILAAVLVLRVAPRIVLLAATSIAVVCLISLATASTAAVFFAVTLAFGFSSTCMFKLMISIGSEQIDAAPPQLVTFLLLSGSVGGTLAPLVSAWIVRAYGPRGGPVLALGCYAAALVAVAVALSIEKSARRLLIATKGAS